MWTPGFRGNKNDVCSVTIVTFLSFFPVACGGDGRGETMMLKLLRLSQILTVNARKQQICLRSEEKGCKESKCGTGHLFHTDQKGRGNQHLLTMPVLCFLGFFFVTVQDQKPQSSGFQARLP